MRKIDKIIKNNRDNYTLTTVILKVSMVATNNYFHYR